MSATITFDDTTLPELQQQKPEAPWGRRTSKFRTVVILAVLIPATVVTLLFWFSSIPGPVIMIAVYFPLQLVASMIAAIAVRGTKAAADAVIIVSAIGATIFSMVVLISVLWTIITKGLQALSGAFIFQNNEYISPSTPLGYGGIGHAILGTVLIVAISAVIAVPLGVMTAVYITEVRGRAVPYVRFFVQAMSGVPSVVAGLFILTVFILTGVLDNSAFAAGLAYAILMLPTVARTAEEVLKLVPDDLRTGAL
ncbi:MAG: Phosphate transport system permease protein PstA, partial [Actinomycetota bacterium]|nr:Phosphate transport system permease protein PstA [Actinomycetota bacterium]